MGRHLCVLAWVTASLLAGCAPNAKLPPAKPPVTAPGPAQKAQRPELTPPVEAALLALRDLNEAGKAKDRAGGQKAFETYRPQWEMIRGPLRAEDPRLEQHIADGAVELDLEFKKPDEQFRHYELTEEGVKLSLLIAKAADLLGVPFKPELRLKDPQAEIPFNQEARIEITAEDHKFLPATVTVEQHTKVSFVITNKGRQAHEFVIGYYGAEVEVLPGESKTLSLVLLDAGEFEFACHMPGHYEVGMYGKLHVKAAELKQR